MKTFESVAFRIMFLPQNTTNLLCTVVRGPISDVLKQEGHVSFLCELFFENAYHSDMLDAVNAIGMCAMR
jgi:hypothetical protein